MPFLYRDAKQTKGIYKLLQIKKLNATTLCKKEIRLLLWNVWSINNDNKLMTFLTFLTERSIDIACVCETWFDSGTGIFSSIIKEMGYDQFHAYRTDKNGGGVSILFRLDIPAIVNETSINKYATFEYSSIIIKHINSSKLLSTVNKKHLFRILLMSLNDFLTYI